MSSPNEGVPDESVLGAEETVAEGEEEVKEEPANVLDVVQDSAEDEFQQSSDTGVAAAASKRVTIKPIPSMTTNGSASNTAAAPSTNSTEEGPPNANLYVDGFGTISEEQLRQAFSPYGTIIRLKILVEKTSGKRYAFIQFQTEEQAQMAITARNGYHMGTTMMRVSIAKKGGEKKERKMPTNFPAAGGFGMGMNPMAMNPMGMNPMGMGMGMNMGMGGGPAMGMGNMGMGMGMGMGAAAGGGLGGPQCNLYVAGLPRGFTKDNLRELFMPYGNVLDIHLLTNKPDPTGKNLGVGFVKMGAPQHAQNAINALNGSIPPGGLDALTVRLARANAAAANAGGGAMGGGLPMGNAFGGPAAMFGGASGGGGGGGGGGYGAVRGNSFGNARANATPYGRGGGGMGGMNMANRGPGPNQFGGGAGFQNFGMGGPGPQNGGGYDQFGNGYGNQGYYGGQDNFGGPMGGGRGGGFGGGANNPAFLQQQQAAIAAGHAGGPDTGISLFVFHLPAETTEDDLYSLFVLYGPVTKVTIIRDKMSGQSKGYGFVNMVNEQDATNAIQYLNGYQIGSKFLKVSFKQNRGAGGPAGGFGGPAGFGQGF